MARVLIVDDEQSYCDSLAVVFSHAGHEVCTAQSTHQGVRAGIDYVPDLLITDWMLKNDLHGGQVAEQIRSVHSKVRTIVITGYLDATRRVEESYKFVDEVIHKPFRAAEILAAADRVLARGETADPSRFE